jgi:hypothetical protein
MGRVDVNPNARGEVMDALSGPWQDRTSELMATTIVTAMPVVTGNMVLETDVNAFTDDEGRPAVRVTGKADYTIFVDQGTGLYGPLHKYITPQVAKALSWIGTDGKRVTRSRTRGQPGQHFFARSLRAIFGRVDEHPYGR